VDLTYKRAVYLIGGLSESGKFKTATKHFRNDIFPILTISVTLIIRKSNLRIRLSQEI